MTEQMYVIAKLSDSLTAPLVPESELLKRLNHIRKPEFLTITYAIEVLLNGVKEE